MQAVGVSRSISVPETLELSSEDDETSETVSIDDKKQTTHLQF